MSSAKSKSCRKRKRPVGNRFSLVADGGVGTFDSALLAVANLLRDKKNIVVLTGAGISVSSGIPDFRSKNVGIYETLDMEELGLSCPEELFDWHFFQEDPVPFYRFARNLYFPNETFTGGQQKKKAQKGVQPSASHKLLALLDKRKRLLRCYSQNIDGLEQKAGVSMQKMVYAHGSLDWGVCLECNAKACRSVMEDDVWHGRVARCRAIRKPSAPSKARNPTRERSSRGRPKEEEQQTIRTRRITRKECACGGVLKPGITFFGESLGDNVSRALQADHRKVDALIVIGTSLSVAPISRVIGFLPPGIPRILINRAIVHPKDTETAAESSDEEEEDFRESYVFDAYLLGFCDDITSALWSLLFPPKDTASDAPTTTEGELLSVVTSQQQKKNENGSELYNAEAWSSVQVPHDRVLLFPGALPPPPKSSSAEDSSYQEIAHCDQCSQRIVGTIRKCLTCFDYDLCAKCYPSARRKHYSGKHKFICEKAAIS